MKSLFLIALLSLFSAGLFAQTFELYEGDTINRIDMNGYKQGYAIIWGKTSKNYISQGFEPNQKVEEGKFANNRKTKTWKKYFVNGKLHSEIEFRSGRPSGKYIVYYPNGKVEEQGTWARNRQKDVFVRYHKNGKVSQNKTFNVAGKAEGKVEYFYENGKPALVYNAVNGKEVGEATWYYPNGDVKRKANFVDGKVGEVKEYERKNAEEKIEHRGRSIDNKTVIAECGTNAADKMKINEYNKLYNDNQQICQDGEFKNGRLWNGKWFRYDKNGLLLRIEVYKMGVYEGTTTITE